MNPSKDQVVERLRRIKGPDLEGNIVDLGLVSEILLKDGRVSFSITVPVERAGELELGLQAIGLETGILDADIYGPSQPRLLGLAGRPQVAHGNTLRPMQAFGLKAMSMGFLVDEGTPIIWRGPMVVSALTQMLRDVDWGELDVLVIDMPP